MESHIWQSDNWGNPVFDALVVEWTPQGIEMEIQFDLIIPAVQDAPQA